MQLNDYQREANRTGGFFVTKEDWLLCDLLGVTGEAGELANEVKKILYHKHEMDKERLILELGDILWYVADLCTVFDTTLEDVAALNIEKLRKRYPNGFTTQESINRKDGQDDDS